MPHCQECKHYKATNDGPYCFKSSGHPKPISPIMVKDCFEERPADEPASMAPVEKPGYVPRTKVCAKCGRELPISAFGKGHSADGLQAFCKECKAEQGRAALAKRWAKDADAIREEADKKIIQEDPAEPQQMVHEFECAIRSFEVLNPIPGGLVEIRLVAAQEDVQGAAMLALGGRY